MADAKVWDPVRPGGHQTTFRGQNYEAQGLVSGDGIPFAARINPNALAVMSSAPTITLTDEANVLWTGSSLSTGRLLGTNNTGSDTTGAPSAFSVFRGSYPAINGTTYPLYYYTRFQTAESGIGAYNNFSLSISLIHSGSKLALALYGQTGHIAVKVNDQWASLTPTAIPNDGGLKVLIVDFGSSATRRVDFLGYNLAHRGVWIDNTDTIIPAPRRGPRVCAISDSFGGGSGNEVSALFSWITYMAEFLGWDDVYSIAAGSTGLVSNGGTKKKYLDRVSRDVLPLNPDIVIVQPSTNDNGQSAATVLAAAQTIYETLRAGGVRTVVFTSPSISGGAGKIVNANSLRLHSNAIKDWCASSAIPFVDWIEQPIIAGNAVAHSTTLTSSPAAGATSFTTAAQLVPGATYKFPDGTACYVRSTSGLTATVDRVPTAQTSGAVVTQCGACVFTGTGRSGATTGWGNADLAISSDDAHPLNFGHRLLGETAARQLAAMSYY